MLVRLQPLTQLWLMEMVSSCKGQGTGIPHEPTAHSPAHTRKGYSCLPTGASRAAGAGAGPLESPVDRRLPGPDEPLAPSKVMQHGRRKVLGPIPWASRPTPRISQKVSCPLGGQQGWAQPSLWDGI